MAKKIQGAGQGAQGTGNKKSKGKKQIKTLFSADLEMRDIKKDGVNYRVLNAEGLKFTGFSHLQAARSNFPEDDDFNLAFINDDLSKIKPANPDDVIDPKAVKKLKEKQKEFRKFTKLRLMIVTS